MPEGEGGQQAGQQGPAGQQASGQQHTGQQSGQQQSGQPGQGSQGGEKPPWEANGQQFDPERAWRLIQNVQSERDGLKTKVTEHEQASMTEQQKLEQRAATAEGQLPTLQSENLRLRAAISAGIDVADVDRLRGNTLAELVEDAKQLKQRYGGGQQPPPRFDHGARQNAGTQSMNDLIFGTRR